MYKCDKKLTSQSAECDWQVMAANGLHLLQQTEVATPTLTAFKVHKIDRKLTLLPGETKPLCFVNISLTFLTIGGPLLHFSIIINNNTDSITVVAILLVIESITFKLLQKFSNSILQSIIRQNGGH